MTWRTSTRPGTSTCARASATSSTARPAAAPPNTVTAGAGAASQIVGRSFAQGALRQTGQPLDVALQGPGFLQVRTPEGQLALTRDGSLRVTNTGQLVTSTGAQVVPPINFPAGIDMARRLGRPRRHDHRRQPADRPAHRRRRPSPQALTSIGDNLFIANAQSGAPRGRPPPPSPAATWRARTSSSPTPWST